MYFPPGKGKGGKGPMMGGPMGGPMMGKGFGPPGPPMGKGFPMMPKGGKGMPFPPRGPPPMGPGMGPMPGMVPPMGPGLGPMPPMPPRGPPGAYGRFGPIPPQQPQQSYGLQIPAAEAVFPFLQRERKLPELCKRQPRNYYSQDLIQEICHWVDNSQAVEIPLDTVTNIVVSEEKTLHLAPDFGKEKESQSEHTTASPALLF